MSVCTLTHPFTFTGYSFSHLLFAFTPHYRRAKNGRKEVKSAVGVCVCVNKILSGELWYDESLFSSAIFPCLPFLNSSNVYCCAAESEKRTKKNIYNSLLPPGRFSRPTKLSVSTKMGIIVNVSAVRLVCRVRTNRVTCQSVRHARFTTTG